MFVGAETVVQVGFAAVRDRLAGLASGGWLAGASGEAFGDLSRGLARVGPLGAVPGISRLVEVQFRDLVTQGNSAVLTLRWQAAGPGGGLFPVLDADMTLAPYGQAGTLIALAGAYRPPLGAAGAALDRVLLRRVAAATIRRFVDRVGQAVADPAAAQVPVADSPEQGLWRFPVVPDTPQDSVPVTGSGQGAAGVGPDPSRRDLRGLGHDLAASSRSGLRRTPPGPSSNRNPEMSARDGTAGQSGVHIHHDSCVHESEDHEPRRPGFPAHLKRS